MLNDYSSRIVINANSNFVRLLCKMQHWQDKRGEKTSYEGDIFLALYETM